MAISTSPLVISIGSGKGGVGKSFLLSNLGYLLAERGFRVVLIDLDLGGADLQIFLGSGQSQIIIPLLQHFVIISQEEKKLIYQKKMKI